MNIQNPSLVWDDREFVGQENGTNDRPDRFHWAMKNVSQFDG
jgi:hypothetical protein